MNARNLLLGIFIVLTLVFASLALNEYEQLNSRSALPVTETTTIPSSATVILPSKIDGSFTYSPIGPVKVISVVASVSQAKSGGPHITFEVTVENTGNSTVYLNTGTWALGATVPANSTVLQPTAPAAECDGSAASFTLNHGENHTLYTPSFCDGLNYQLVQLGKVNATLGFTWTTNEQDQLDPANATSISAQFNFA